MNDVARSFILGLSVLTLQQELSACSFPGPPIYLLEDRYSITDTPGFYWALEVKRLAREYAASEQWAPPLRLTADSKSVVAADRLSAVDMTKEADAKDFAAAIQTGAIRPPDAEEAIAKHARGRATDGGEEFDSEFADYHRGARAYHRGREHRAEAAAAWQKLLERPAGERQYRSVWATFMLGKLALEEGRPEAAGWFQRTRELAQQGFHDSLGLAADSYGWEARCQLRQKRPDLAAPLYLRQLALGDEGAIYSLRTVVAEADRQMAAQDPLLRRLVTLELLASFQNRDFYEPAQTQWPDGRDWLAALKATELKVVEDAEYLGWIAYASGNYEDATHWLRLAAQDKPVACWLGAKLEWRKGNTKAAAASMAKAWKSVRTEVSYTGWEYPWGVAATDNSWARDQGLFSFGQCASGDLGSLYLSRGDFVQALDIFLQGGLWNDAAYVAERVLSADELKAYVEKRAGQEKAELYPEDFLGNLRYLLGRRLVREKRYAEAKRYLPPPFDKMLSAYGVALRKGTDRRLSRKDRARAWFTAASIARYAGMELMGTEAAPDGFQFGGNFPAADIGQLRQTGEKEVMSYDGEPNKIVPLALTPRRKELARLPATATVPNLRFHYRVVAAKLAMRAAALLPNGSEELADVINSAGNWVKNTDNKLADRYYYILERRCPETAIGRAVLERHWFVPLRGAWSLEQDEALRKLEELPVTQVAVE